MYQVLQIPMTREMANRMNEIGRMEAEKEMPSLAAYTSLSLFGADKYEPDMFQYYRPVVEVEGSDLEDVFRTLNCYDDITKIKVLGEFRSLSVGDIVRDPSGDYHIVDTFGFQKVQF